MANAVGVPEVRWRDIARMYRRGNVLVPVLREITLDAEPGEWVAILEPSGKAVTRPVQVGLVTNTDTEMLVAGVGPASQAVALEPASALRYE